MSDDALAIARQALGGTSAWLVGGAVRDRLLGRSTADLDLAVGGDVEAMARALSRAARAAVFPLSEDFGAWRVVARGGKWQADLSPLLGQTIEQDLAQRDFTINAIAEPLAGGELVDPTGGVRGRSTARPAAASLRLRAGARRRAGHAHGRRGARGRPRQRRARARLRRAEADRRLP
jgi:poly(A) polymerase